MVGAGGSGCEFAKTCALMEVGSEEPGWLYVFDDDFIELSNLNRQHMFTREDVGLPKATSLARRLREMRPSMRVSGICKRLDESTLGSAGVAWEEVDLLVSAVDSRGARCFISRLGALLNIPVANLGVAGLDGECHFCVPGVTQSLEATVNEGPPPAEDQRLALSCSTRAYPENPAHCIQWAKEQYEYVFHEVAELLRLAAASPSRSALLALFSQKYANHTGDYPRQLARDASSLIRLLKEEEGSLARSCFTRLFISEVAEAMDSKQAEFWETHRKPRRAEWSSTEGVDDFLRAFQKLEAAVFPFEALTAELKENRKSQEDAADEEESKEEKTGEEFQYLDELVSLGLRRGSIEPRPFVKTDTESTRVIHALATIRARQFYVEPVSKRVNLANNDRDSEGRRAVRAEHPSDLLASRWIAPGSNGDLPALQAGEGRSGSSSRSEQRDCVSQTQSDSRLSTAAIATTEDEARELQDRSS